ncbi:LysM peptidoglycan-binding domain-containing protein [Streptomyces sp. NPDC085942]|uniref:LysM peptidoglycan-binding domain-containing protein n=1 Tax=Streptomyces sp. NPDC085942 TaxID=3365743 RepID=UPI0037D4E189
MPRTPAPLRTVGVLLRALLGLALLLALIAGAPYLLLAVGHQPTELSGGLDLLMQQDDGTLFLVVLTCLGWAGWALFTLSVLVEVVAVLRRRSAPRIKGLGGIQSLASFLIGSIVLLAPTAASAATSTPAVAVSTVHVAQAGPHSPTDARAAAPAPEADRPQHTVQSATELPWDLAEEYLGDGKRWKDIAALNPHIPQLAAGDQFLPQGAVLHLPADARPAAPARSTAPAAGSTADRDEAPRTPAHTSYSGAAGAGAAQPDRTVADEAPAAQRQYTVEAGDSLFGIAQDQLGDGDRWSDLYEENRGSKQPNGQTFTDPDLIFPGQELLLPHAGPAGVEDTAPEKSTPPPDRTAPPQAEADTGADEAPDRQEPDSALAPGPGRTAKPAPPAPAPSTALPSTPPSTSPAPTAPSTAPAASTDGADDQERAGSRVGVLGLAATGALAAGILAAVGARRILQQRRRRPGRRIAMPQGQAARTETALRSADAGVELTLLGAALRTAALHLADEGRPLPDLAAVQLGAEGIRLHLDAPAPPCPPFTADPQQSTRWWCPAGSQELLPEDELREVDAPYPGLVALGQDEDGAIVLVDLEHLGALHLTGAARIDVLRTLAVTLALSPLAGQLDLAVAGEDTAPGLSMLDSDRITPYPDLAGAVEAMTRHHDEQQQVLEALGEQGTLSQARPCEDVGELWPLVVVADLDTCNATPEAVEGLWERLGGPVRTAMAIITSSTGTPPDDVGWSLDTDAPAVTVPGTDVSVLLSACSAEEYADILELALTADSPTDVPAPAPAQQPRGDERPESGTAESGTAAPRPAAPAEAETPPKDDRRGALADLADLEDEAPDEEEGEKKEESGASAEAGRQEAASQRKPSPAAAASPSDVVLPAVVSAPRVSARIPLPTEPEQDAAPVARVLGPVDVQGARGTVASNRRTLALELTVWLALHPGATNHQIDEVLAPGGRVTRDTRNSRVGDVRRWLGADADGNRYLPHVSTQPDKLYRLAADVDCDWTRFQHLVAQSHATADAERGRRLLHQALDLVAGRPFSGIPPRRYVWAEPLVQDMISAIVDAADDLAAQYLDQGDGRGALWAAARGLDAAREVESLWRHKFRALALLGDDNGLETAVRQLEALLLDLGCTMSEETGAVLQALQATRR